MAVGPVADGLDELAADGEVARDGARLQKRLTLPGLAHGAVVGDAGSERARQRADGALGAKA